MGTGTRTCGRIAARPYNLAVELEGALERGDLECADYRRLRLGARTDRPRYGALRFLPLVAAAGECDAWTVRWLRRWASETPRATIEAAAEIAGSLCRATAFRGQASV